MQFFWNVQFPNYTIHAICLSLNSSMLNQSLSIYMIYQKFYSQFNSWYRKLLVLVWVIIIIGLEFI